MDVLRFEEAAPASYPSLITYDPEGLPNEEPLIVERGLWDRLEQYTCHRFKERQVVWTVCGPGEWLPHLTPISNINVDVWSDTQLTYSSVSLNATPLGGLCIPDSRTYRITATAGDDAAAIPELVTLAYERLQAYHADCAYAPAGVSNYTSDVPWHEEITRSPTWIAKALQYSGAADLLRAYRRVQ